MPKGTLLLVHKITRFVHVLPLYSGPNTSETQRLQGRRRTENSGASLCLREGRKGERNTSGNLEHLKLKLSIGKLPLMSSGCWLHFHHLSEASLSRGWMDDLGVSWSYNQQCPRSMEWDDGKFSTPSPKFLHIPMASNF